MSLSRLIRIRGRIIRLFSRDPHYVLLDQISETRSTGSPLQLGLCMTSGAGTLLLQLSLRMMYGCMGCAKLLALALTIEAYDPTCMHVLHSPYSSCEEECRFMPAKYDLFDQGIWRRAWTLRRSTEVCRGHNRDSSHMKWTAPTATVGSLSN